MGKQNRKRKIKRSEKIIKGKEEQMEAIKIRGLKQNNLKNISLDIPKNKIVVFTGVSGSGKSSIVFDTIAAESQRQMNAWIFAKGGYLFVSRLSFIGMKCNVF